MIETLNGGGPARPLALLAVIGLVAAEWLWLAWRRSAPSGYDLRETAVSTLIAVGNRLLRPLSAALLAPLFLWVHQHRLLDLQPSGAPGYLGAFLLVDFVYYWLHRSSHRIRWLWATHGVHHSSTRFNLSAAYRLGWTDLFSGTWLFALGLVWLGLPPLVVVGALGLNLLFQFLLHTELVGRLGWLEWLLNTPDHHRVHHALNASVRDRNFGGVLIVWDRLFGTYTQAPAHETLRYGVAGREPSHHPLHIVFGEWLALYRDLRKVRGLRQALSLLFMPR